MRTKRILALLVATVISVASLGMTAMADSNKISIKVDGKKVNTDLAYVSEEGRMMIPISFVAKEMGMELDWDQDSKAATFTKKGHHVFSYMEGYEYATIAGYDNWIETKPVIKDGRMYISVRSLGIGLMRNVDWDEKTKTISINMKDPIDPKILEENHKRYQEYLGDERNPESTLPSEEKQPAEAVLPFMEEPQGQEVQYQNDRIELETPVPVGMNDLEITDIYK